MSTCANCGHRGPADWFFTMGHLVCSLDCGQTVEAYERHRRRRYNNWPTSEDWRRFAAIVADVEQGMIVDVPPEGWSEAWDRRNHDSRFKSFWAGLCLYCDDGSDAYRLGCECRRARLLRDDRLA